MRKTVGGFLFYSVQREDPAQHHFVELYQRTCKMVLDGDESAAICLRLVSAAEPCGAWVGSAKENFYSQSLPSSSASSNSPSCDPLENSSPPSA